mmetsp:Transcript_42364/g.100522  ORF Transcript_42364/g.100522 Transcript_42364/m.100522 type:complete len:542 (+) Transcript_42364:438-2063(+)
MERTRDRPSAPPGRAGSNRGAGGDHGDHRRAKLRADSNVPDARVRFERGIPCPGNHREHADRVDQVHQEEMRHGAVSQGPANRLPVPYRLFHKECVAAAARRCRAARDGGVLGRVSLCESSRVQLRDVPQRHRSLQALDSRVLRLRRLLAPRPAVVLPYGLRRLFRLPREPHLRSGADARHGVHLRRGGDIRDVPRGYDAAVKQPSGVCALHHRVVHGGPGQRAERRAFGGWARRGGRGPHRTPRLCRHEVRLQRVLPGQVHSVGQLHSRQARSIQRVYLRGRLPKRPGRYHLCLLRQPRHLREVHRLRVQQPGWAWSDPGVRPCRVRLGCGARGGGGRNVLDDRGGDWVRGDVDGDMPGGVQGQHNRDRAEPRHVFAGAGVQRNVLPRRLPRLRRLLPPPPHPHIRPRRSPRARLRTVLPRARLGRVRARLRAGAARLRSALSPSGAGDGGAGRARLRARTPRLGAAARCIRAAGDGAGVPRRSSGAGALCWGAGGGGAARGVRVVRGDAEEGACAGGGGRGGGDGADGGRGAGARDVCG